MPIAAVARARRDRELAGVPTLPSQCAALGRGVGVALHLLELVATAGRRRARRPRRPARGASIRLSLDHRIASWRSPASAPGTPQGEALRRWGWVAVIALWGGLLAALGAGTANDLSGITLHFLDVGQGDAALSGHPRDDGS